MGTSYNTLIFYGVDLGDLTDPITYESWAPAWMLDEHGGIDDWDPDDHLARKLGWQDVPFPEHAVITAPDRYGYPSKRMNVEHPDYVAYRANRERRSEILKETDYGCTLDSYGHAEGDLTLLVQVDASAVKGDVWTCKPIPDPGPMREPHWRRQLERYLDALDIPLERCWPPRWHLTGWVG